MHSKRFTIKIRVIKSRQHLFVYISDGRDLIEWADVGMSVKVLGDIDDQ